MKKVLIIGAGGQMTGRAGRVLAEMSDLDAEYVFTDINVAAIDRLPTLRSAPIGRRPRPATLDVR